MLALNRMLQTIAKQLQGFSATARLLIASLMVILVMALILVATYAGRADLVPLRLDGNAAAKTQAVNYLEDRQIDWSDSGADILVPVEHRFPILAHLAENQHITTDQIDFDSIMTEDSPFMGRDARKTRYLVAKMNEVGRMISELTGVSRARVVIDQPNTGVGLGAAHVEPSATVSVVTSGDQLSRSMADAIARMVAGAHATLKTERVTVVDARTGRALRSIDADAEDVSGHLDLKRAHENRINEKIRSVLDYIPAVRVEVNAQVDGSAIVTHKVGVDEPKIGVEREINSERASTNSRTSGEPGVRPNTGVQIAGAAGGSNSTETKSDVKTTPAFPVTESNIKEDRGFAVKINASVGVPRSYFVSLYKQDNPDQADEPNTATLDPIIKSETERIRRQIEPLIDTDTAEGSVQGTVAVTMIPDLVAPGGTMAGASGAMLASTEGGGVSGLLADGMVRTIGLAALALVSLALMFMMVRRAGRQEEMPSAEELVGIPPALSQTDNDLVGEAMEGVAAMEGLEISEEDIRRQQMLEQINDLAAETPNEAASLLRKWIKTDV
jgi:flagellar biosynthesis/type III secretory pathway M-ring protein FliF/YscJ